MGGRRTADAERNGAGCRIHHRARRTRSVQGPSPRTRRWPSHGCSDSRKTRSTSDRSVPGAFRASAGWTSGERDSRQARRQAGLEVAGHEQDRSGARKKQENRRGSASRRNIQCDRQAVRYQPGAREADCGFTLRHFAPSDGHQTRTQGRATGAEGIRQRSQACRSGTALRPHARARGGRNFHSTGG